MEGWLSAPEALCVRRPTDCHRLLCIYVLVTKSTFIEIRIMLDLA